ncbi:hypothetical protein BZG36_01032 [Bifiguratus adelaidae]|uniref:Uncharacterized protein n=1 Tax=Bifiguratus adelaidae TaxID=1938954 RepID=A0A261Y6C3_9FUNG|nr:hypothetical protein BZG36_01032 [Bifiguratus adelaidae]
MNLWQRKLFRLLLGALLSSLTLLILYQTKWIRESLSLRRGTDEYMVQALDKVPASSWSCQGKGRGMICTYSNLCISSTLEDFVVTRDIEPAEPPPAVNIINADPSADLWWAPKIIQHSDLPREHAVYVNETVFVYGLYSPWHFSHMLFNGLIPLWQTMQEHGATRKSWTYRAMNFWGDPNSPALIDTDFITDAPDIVQNYWEAVTHKQQVRSRAPICFARAVVGTGNACSLEYCERPIYAKMYQSFRTQAAKFYSDHARWDMKAAHSNEHDMACVNSAVEEHIGSSERPMVIGFINRKSRNITNIPDAVNVIRDIAKRDHSSFLIRHIEFDHGCSLMSTEHVVRDLDILITPHGSQEGAAIYMKDNSVVLSIDHRGYWEPWFQWVMTAMGRRFYNFMCNDDSCLEFDPDTAKKLLLAEGIQLNREAVSRYISWKGVSPTEWLTEHLKSEGIGDTESYDTALRITYEYLKSAPRKIDLGRFSSFFSRIVREFGELSQLSFPEICRRGKCCGFSCQEKLGRNVFGSLADGRVKAWDGPVSPAGPDWHEDD